MESTITSKWQTTIPKFIRTLLDIMPGDRLIYKVTSDGVSITKHPGLSSLKGSLIPKIKVNVQEEKEFLEKFWQKKKR